MFENHDIIIIYQTEEGVTQIERKRRLPSCSSVDYDPHSMESLTFFKIVQNKLHFTGMGIRLPNTRMGKPPKGLCHDVLDSRGLGDFVRSGFRKMPLFKPVPRVLSLS